MDRRHIAPLTLLLPALAGLFGLAGCEAGHAMAHQERYNNCAPCHGPDGSGNRAVGAPAIAGLPAWYVEAQLRKFRDGQRGAHPLDEAGLKMRPMARTLPGDQDIRSVAKEVEALPQSHAAPVLTGGDAAHGWRLYQPCIACHTEHGWGRRDTGSPDLRYTGDWYLLSQLKKFKEGIRGAVPGDTTGAQMRPMAATLLNEQDMKDVVAYITTILAL